MNQPNNETLQSPFLSATHWAEKEVIDYLRRPVEEQLASLSYGEKVRYRQLLRQYAASLKNVALEDQNLKETFKTDGVALIKAHLLELTGKEIDPHNVYLHTQFLHVPERVTQFPIRYKRESNTDQPDMTLPEAQALKEASAPVVHVLSMSLWQAACTNFGFLAHFASFRSDSFVNASFINDSPGVGFEHAQIPDRVNQTSLIPVSTFVQMSRELDLGADLKYRVDDAMSDNGSMRQVLSTYIKAQVQFCLMELYRASGSNQAVKTKVKALSDALHTPSKNLQVRQIVLTLKFTTTELLSGSGFHLQSGLSLSSRPAPEVETDVRHISIPLYQIHLTGHSGIYSFFPGRPEGELRFHDNATQLIDDFKQQLLKAHAEKTLDWFKEQLSDASHHTLTRVVSEPADPTGFIVFRRQPRLHRVWIAFDELGFKPMSLQHSLEDALYSFQSGLYMSRLEALAVKKSVKDWDDVVAAVNTLIDEISGMLLIPVPGATQGLTTFIRALFIGATTRSVFSALEQFTRDDSSGLAQQLVDAVDLLMTPLLHTKAGKLAQRRHSQLLQKMGQPRIYTRSDGTTDVWQSDPTRFVLAPEAVLGNMQVDEQGIYRQDGRDYVFLEQDGRQFAVEIERYAEGNWRAIAQVDPTAFRPPIAWNETERRWRLMLDDTHALNDVQLLCRMLPHLPVKEAQTLLNICAVDRASLQAIWQGGHSPASLTDAVIRFQADQRLQRCAQGLSQYAQSPLISDRILLALLVELEYWPTDLRIIVFDHEGKSRESYGAVSDTPKVHDAITVMRLEDGEYVLNTSPLRNAFNGDLLSEVITFLALPTDLLKMTDSLTSQLIKNTAHLFAALTSNKDRSPAIDLPRHMALTYLPLDSANRLAAWPIIDTLRTSYPEFSQARCLELLRRYPELSRYSEQHVDLQKKLEATGSNTDAGRLFDALKKASFSARLERMLDAIYHVRDFNPDADKWSREVCTSMIKQWFDLALIINDGVQSTDGVPTLNRYNDDQVVITYLGAGDYTAYDTQRPSPPVTVSGPDSFFNAVIAGLSASPRLKHHLSASLLTAAGWRKAVGDEIVAHRTQEGFIKQARPQVERYALPAFVVPPGTHPNRMGIYTFDEYPCIFFDGHGYQVQSETKGFVNKIVHPDLFARAPIVVYGNGEGAWCHPHERPIEWEGHYLFKRLGHRIARFNNDQISAILNVSGTTEKILRRVHLNHEKTPPLLLDTLERFTHIQGVETVLSSQGEQVYAALLNYSQNALDGRVLYGISAPLTPAQMQTFRELVTPEDRIYEAFTQTPDQLVYLNLLYLYLSKTPRVGARDLFNLIAQTTENRLDPPAALIKRLFPNLTACIAQDMVHSANQFEINQMMDSGRIPLRIAQEARGYLRALRLNRALEGFYLPAIQNNDSVKLMMHWLGLEPGWLADIHIEIREDEGSGRVISQLGAATAKVQLHILKVVHGWQVDVATSREVKKTIGLDLFTVLLEALPENHRQALGYTQAGGPSSLKERLTLKVVENRDTSLEILNMAAQLPWFSWPKRLGDGRLGYELSGRGAGLFGLHEDPLRRRYVALYPATVGRESVSRINAMLDRGLDVAAELARLEAEFGALKQQLQEWIETRPDFDVSGVLTQTHRISMANALVRAWRRETPTLTDQTGRILGHTLVLENMRVSALPVITGDFSHVCQLTLAGLGLGEGMGLGVEANLNQFLRSFGALTSLSIQRCAITSFPDAIGELPNLIKLSLTHNVMTLDHTAQTTLGKLVNLQHLNVTGCRLIGRFDVRTLSQLRVLNLSNTETAVWPLGVLQLTHLTRLDLSRNSIMQVLPDVLAGPLAVNRVTFLQDNPLAPSALQQLRDYHVRTGISFGLHHDVDHPPLLAFDSQVWLNGLGVVEKADRQQECQLMQADPRADSFFELLESLKTTADYSNDTGDFVRRVQALLKAAAKDAHLRSDVFELAAEPRQCCDSVALIFSRLQTQVLVHEALAKADPVEAELSLAQLIRGQFRLHHVDHLAAEHAKDRERKGEVIDEVEIAFTYRLALKEALQLPAQPRSMRFVSMGTVEKEVVDKAKETILQMDNTESMLSFMTQDPFWIKFLKARYADQFSALSAAKAQIDFDAMPSAANEDYTTTIQNFESWQHEHQALLTELTRQALAKL